MEIRRNALYCVVLFVVCSCYGHTTEELKDHYEAILRQVEDPPVLKLSSCSSSSSDVQGYLSESQKITCRGIRVNGQEYLRNFYVKKFNDTDEVHKIMRLHDVHFNEVHYYRNIQPAIGYFGAPFVHASKTEIILEDLSYGGYRVKPVPQMLDYKEAFAAMKRLAQFHAASLNVKLSNPQKFSELVRPLREVCFPEDRHWTVANLIKFGLSFALEVLKDQPNFQEAYQTLSQYRTNIVDIMTDLVRPRLQPYDVLTHGDMWKNNVLFREISRYPDAKFIDFQIIRHGSVALDLHYLMYTSVSSDILESPGAYFFLLEFYRTELARNVANKRVAMKLDEQWLKSEMNSYALFGLMYSFMTIQATCEQSAEEQGFSKHNVMERSAGDEASIVGAMENHMKVLKHNSLKSKRILSVVKHFMENYQVNLNENALRAM